MSDSDILASLAKLLVKDTKQKYGERDAKWHAAIEFIRTPCMRACWERVCQILNVKLVRMADNAWGIMDMNRWRIHVIVLDREEPYVGWMKMHEVVEGTDSTWHVSVNYDGQIHTTNWKSTFEFPSDPVVLAKLEKGAKSLMTTQQ